MKQLKNFLMLLLLITGFTSCNDNEDTTQVTLSINEATFDLNGGSKTFTIQTTGNWSIETDNQNWYSLSPTQGSGTTEVNVTAKPLEGNNGRSANIIIHSDNSTATLILSQINAVSPNNPTNQTITIRGKGGDKEIILPENNGYSINIPSDALKWISLKEQNTNSVTLSFTANNETDQYRSAMLTVNKPDGSSLATLHIKQSWRNIEPGELLIEEIFLTSNLLSTGKIDSKNMEQYFLLTNNTNEPLEIGGVAFGESEIVSYNNVQSNLVWNPDLRNERAAINSLYVIPTDKGKQTLAAHESILIANNAQNYKKNNNTSFNLSKADFEWYNESTVSSVLDTDNPDVPNMDIWVSGTISIYTLNTQMNKAYALITLPSTLTAESYAQSTDYLWSGTRSWTVTSTGKDFNIAFNYKTVPNEWIVDAVVVSIQNHFKYNPFNNSLDAGFTYCATSNSDTSRYGKSMRRKHINGILADTNNSTNDFEHCAVPSLAK